MLAIVMAGCTKDVHDATLPVPVLFGGVSSEVLITKAVISSDADLAGRTFGVSAFDLSSGNLTEDDGMNLRNASARSSISGGKGVLTLDQKTFYPMGSDAEFSFYSYYPYAETTYGQNRKQAFVTIPVANTTDVLWAFAGGTKGGYNADYIRSGGPAPTFKYKHKTASISFNAYKDQEDVDVTIVNIGLAGVATKAKFCIADIENPENEGKFIELIELSTKTSPRQVTNLSGSGGNLSSFVITTEPKPISQPIFIVPTEKVLVMADIRIGGNTARNWVEFEIDPSELGAVEGDKGEKGFLAGHSYVFNLKVISEASDVKFAVSLDSEDEVLDFDENQWKDAFTNQADE